MKKIVGLLLAVVLLMITLSSCSAFEKDPEDFMSTLEDAGFYVELMDTQRKIKDIAEDFDIRERFIRHIECIVFCENEEEGYFIFCENTSTAKDITESLEEQRKYQWRIQRKGKIVYIGSEENWIVAREYF